MTTNVDTILNISANLGGQQAVEAMRSGVAGIATAYDRIKIAQSSVVTGLRGLAAAVGAGVFAEIIKGTADYGEQLDLIKQKTGVAVDEVARWGEAGQLVNVSLDTIETGFKRMSKAALDAEIGNAKAAAAFKAVNISVKDLKSQSPDEIMLRISDAFAKMPDGIAKAGLAMQLFGKGGTDMIPLLNMGRDAIEGMNTAVTEHFTDASVMFNQSMKLMEQNVLNMKISFADGLLPALADSAKALSEFNSQGSFLSAVGRIVGDGVTLMTSAFIHGSENVKDFWIYITHLNQALGDIANGHIKDLPNVMADAAKQVVANHADAKKALDQIYAHSNLAGNQNVPLPKAKKKSGSDAGVYDAFAGASGEVKKYQDAMTKLKASDDEQLQSLNDQIDALGKTKAQIENLKDARQTQKNIQDQTINMTQPQVAAYTGEANAALQLREALRLKNETEEQTFGFGVQQWAAKYQQTVSDAASNASQIMQKSFDSMSTGLANFISGAKVNWSQMVQSFLADMIKMQLQSKVFGPLAGLIGSGFSGLFGGGSQVYSSAIGPTLPGAAMGFASGGVMTSRGPVQLRRYSSGGVANSPQLAEFGEGASPEAYVPLPDGRSIPVNISGGASGDTNMNMHFYMGDGSKKSDASGPDSDKAQSLGLLLTNTVKSVLVNEKRPGGLLSASPVGG